MTASYPNSLASFTTKSDAVDNILASHINRLQEEIVALETMIGTAPAAGAIPVGAGAASLVWTDSPTFTDLTVNGDISLGGGKIYTTSPSYMLFVGGSTTKPTGAILSPTLTVADGANGTGVQLGSGFSAGGGPSYTHDQLLTVRIARSSIAGVPFAPTITDGATLAIEGPMAGTGGTSITNKMTLWIQAGGITFNESVGANLPGAPAADRAVIYCQDNGSGKTQLMVRFPTGAAQQLAIEA